MRCPLGGDHRTDRHREGLKQVFVFDVSMLTNSSMCCLYSRRCVMDSLISPQLWHLTRCRRSLPLAVVLEEYECILSPP